MATHPSVLPWRRIPWTEEPDRLQSMGSQNCPQLKWVSTHSYREHSFSDHSNRSKGEKRLKWKKQHQHGVRFCSLLLHLEERNATEVWKLPSSLPSNCALQLRRMVPTYEEVCPHTPQQLLCRGARTSFWKQVGPNGILLFSASPFEEKDFEFELYCVLSSSLFFCFSTYFINKQ